MAEESGNLAELPLVEVRTCTADRPPAPLRLKRLLDLVLAVVAIVLLSPVFLGIAIGIRLSSTGPVLYRQRRIRQGGELFVLYKFRTMIEGADLLLDEVVHMNQASGPLFKINDDPRITRLGRFLRRHYLDELPQLFNVLRGDMGLVGPRPCLTAEEARHPAELAFRFTVPQGITGPWQTNGHHALNFEEQLRVEREYVEGWWLGSDLMILLRTIPLLIRRTGV